MTYFKLNPFHYGKPVPPAHFVGRQDALRMVFARVANSESTALVGQPHIGKSSFLRYVRDERVAQSWLGDTSGYAFVDIDCHLIPQSYQPMDFWCEVLDRMSETFSSDQLRKQIEVVRQSGYGSFTLKRLFDLLGRDDRRVVLLIDEFDILLHHPNFNTAEFFGALRSLAIQTDGLALITSSRLSVAEMNRRSHEINPLGSPFFNNLIEVRLLPLRPPEMEQLIDQALEQSGVSFSQDERAHIAHLSGRHPFLLQIACAALFEMSMQREVLADRLSDVERKLQHWAADHFGDVWRHLPADARRAMLVLACAELQAGCDLSQLGSPEHYDSMLHWLSGGGLIEVSFAPHTALWRGERWRVSAASFARWMIDNRKWEDVEGQASVAPPDAAERSERIAFLRKKIKAARKRLEQRELQRAQQGVNADPIVATEIEELRREVGADERELQRLGGRV